ncbi:hypothetical protein B0H15DRAFT_820906 [Mycena belliarum]|uniref:Uncharacterized protein n=1 Tax=Mycena belliarum TaxID=1033014 RepID=A0AAD6UEG3_9AGAR|nr:hypothetical protein B0H15DRAFT_820906 [Mycena belliae]
MITGARASATRGTGAWARPSGSRVRRWRRSRFARDGAACGVWGSSLRGEREGGTCAGGRRRAAWVRGGALFRGRRLWRWETREQLPSVGGGAGSSAPRTRCWAAAGTPVVSRSAEAGGMRAVVGGVWVSERRRERCGFGERRAGVRASGVFAGLSRGAGMRPTAVGLR